MRHDPNHAVGQHVLDIEGGLLPEMRAPCREVIQILGEDFFRRADHVRPCGAGEALDPFVRKVLNIREGDPVKGVGKKRVHGWRLGCP